MYAIVGEQDFNYLLADPEGCDKIIVSMEPGNGTVKRGTVCYKKESGMYAPAAAANAVITNALVVLDETVDTDANATIGENAAAFRAGKLIAGKVVLAEDATLTAAAAVVLRAQGIVLESMTGTATFDNEVEGD